jgi:16S rRNA G966 N2-methylase RsmD
MDPPYGSEAVTLTLEGLAQWGLLGKGGLLVAEMPAREPNPVTKGFTPAGERVYGDVKFVIYTGPENYK